MKKLNFRTHENQMFSGMGGLRTVKYIGKCVICKSNTYRMYNEKGEDDTDARGPLGENHTNYNLIPSEYGYSGDEIILCYGCASDSETYHKALTFMMVNCIEVSPEKHFKD